MKLVTILLIFFISSGCNSSDLESNNSKQSEVVTTNNDTSMDNKLTSFNDIDKLPNQILVGIQSIIEKDNAVEINVYAFNDTPIAGIQLQINPSDIFQIDSIGGGRCSEIDFTLRSNLKGLMLGFSMSGNMIPVSNSKKPSENILFTAFGRVVKNVNSKNIVLDATLAGKGGVKLDALTVPYEWMGR